MGVPVTAANCDCHANRNDYAAPLIFPGKSRLSSCCQLLAKITQQGF
jgi:hypothetical protein